MRHRMLIAVVFVVAAFLAVRASAAAAAAPKCVATGVVTIDVKKGSNNVVVTPKCVSVKGGEKVKWEIRSDDKTATFAVLDFLDNADQAAAAGKKGLINPMPVGDHCEGSDTTCSVTFTVKKGLYHYVAKVRHEGKVKKSDPEVEVSCTVPCPGVGP